MPKKEKRGLLILVVGAAILIALMVMFMGKKEDKTDGENEAPKEEFVQTLDDGTRLNTSTKLISSATFDYANAYDFSISRVK